MKTDYEQRLGLTGTEIGPIHADITEAEKAIQRWDALYEVGRLEMDDYLRRTEPHVERLKVLRRRLEEVRKTPAPPPKEVLAQFLVTFPEIWEEADAHERKALLQHFVQGWGAAIYIYPGQRLEVLPATMLTE